MEMLFFFLAGFLADTGAKGEDVELPPLKEGEPLLHLYQLKQKVKRPNHHRAIPKQDS